MQSVSSRIWTRVAVSISYDDNHYTTGTMYHFYYVAEPYTEKQMLTLSIGLCINLALFPAGRLDASKKVS